MKKEYLGEIFIAGCVALSFLVLALLAGMGPR